MKKLKLQILLCLFTIIISQFSKAQIKCIDPCTNSTSEMFMKTFCEVNTDCGTYPLVYVIINYHKYSCPGKPDQIVIENFVSVNDLNTLGTSPNIWGLINIIDPLPPLPANPLLSSYCKNQYDAAVCQPIPGIGNIPPTFTPQELKKLFDIAVLDLMNSLAPSGTSTWDVDVIFPGSCFSFVTVQVPNQTTHIVFNPNDYGPVPNQLLAPKSIINWAIPCNDVCCKTRFTAKLIERNNIPDLETNYTMWEYKVKEFVDRGQSTQDCQSQALPDFQTSKGRPKNIKIYDTNNVLIDAPLTVLRQTTCALTCGYAPQPPLYKTSGIQNKVKLQLNAKPTLIENSIYLTEEEILKVSVFDLKGEKVLEVKTLTNGELNTSSLKQGLYFIQVYTSDVEVSTIKVVKP